jgi:hydrogenase nickel incorporation protein HypB
MKYPLMFRACELVMVNKIDLLPHLDYDIDRLEANIAQVNPGATTMRVSARTGDGVDAFRRWLVGLPVRTKVPA